MSRRERILARPLLAIFAAFGAASSLSAAPILFVGDAGISGIQRYDLDGNLLGSFGPSGATGVALDGMGHVFLVQPADTESVISTYDASNNPLNSITFTSGTDNGNGFPGYINGATWGAGSLWLAGYNGMVYRVNTAGVVLSSFDTGSTFTGVATDGTYLYTTQGLGGGNIIKRNLDGSVISTIVTGLSESFGLGFDAASGAFYVGGSDVVTRVDSTGMVLGALSIPGIHTGLAVGEIGVAAV